MRKALIAAAVVGAMSLFSSGTRAAISYSYVTDAPSYTIAPGANLTVLVYLDETLTSGSTSLIVGNSGLFAGGYSVTQNSAGLPANPSQILSIAGSTTSNGMNFPGGVFGQVAANETPTFFAGDNAVNINASSGPTPNGSGLIELGAITITGGSTPGTTHFTLGNYAFPTSGASAGGYTETFGNNYDLDVTSANPAYTGASGIPGEELFNVTVASPEPASMAVLGLGSAGMLIRRRRRRA